jgi:hypothetical protein
VGEGGASEGGWRRRKRSRLWWVGGRRQGRGGGAGYIGRVSVGSGLLDYMGQMAQLGFAVSPSLGPLQRDFSKMYIKMHLII